jgi:hypothetical protein
MKFTTQYRKTCQQASAISICLLEWDSQDPPLFPGLGSARTPLGPMVYKIQKLFACYLNISLVSSINDLWIYVQGVRLS